MASLWQRVKKWFNGDNDSNVANNRLPSPSENRNVDSSYSRTNKKFQINNTISNEEPLIDATTHRTTKKFEIKETKTINISRQGGNRGFANANVSRPRQCPYCRAEGTIVKADNGRDWECSTVREGCGYKWR